VAKHRLIKEQSRLRGLAYKDEGRVAEPDDSTQRNPTKLYDTTIEPERALLVGLQWSRQPASLALEFLDELDMLAQTAGATVVGREMVKRAKQDAALFVGEGKATELTEIAEELRADIIIFDEDLSPSQTRNLERVTERRVIDRSGIILDIFAKRARSREAKTQVELAQLKYMLPRLAGAWTHLERQRGGIGMRGPGETQIETDRRIVRTKIAQLEEELKHIERVHDTQRANRDEIFRFALAGYTNAGKSTLMNVLTNAGVYEENLLFATLDSTTRAMNVAAGEKALLSDTVGFIRKLPPGLVASFRSTLAEIREANCIIHVVDISASSFREQMVAVETILAEMNVVDRPIVVLFNKIDALEDDVHVRWANAEHPQGILASARTGKGIDELLERLLAVMREDRIELSLFLAPEAGKLLAELYRHGEVFEAVAEADGMRLRVRIARRIAQRLGIGEGGEAVKR
jgi:GTP-binding protein HflX